MRELYMRNFSIIIPVYNEAKILATQVRRIIAKVEALGSRGKYEIVLVENGSRDKTYNIALRLQKKYNNIKIVKINEPSYGMAFKAGILKAKYPVIVQFDIDFWDIEYLKKSITHLSSYDFVIGSKNLNGSKDRRTIIRKFLSKLIEVFIRVRFRVNISDTHGLKILKRDKILPLIEDMSCTNHFFDSELLLHCIAAGQTFTELPVSLIEIRKSRFPFLVRSIEVLKEFAKLLTCDLGQKKYSQPVIPAKAGIHSLNVLDPASSAG